ncbi:MAG: CoB--CoM heterodisulfide reductase iron-sulfur subunit A family protein [Desulfamplus sp.]|nr:CoB--CoM heterodisulfide reductase iron-sulfur subunit A family protein [Desulfamplus sp.]
MSNNSVTGAVLVAGGGIGGIQAALDLANSGYYVYMVEKSPSIGGVMAQLDKTFPTNDCSMCIMSPKLVEVGRHINIELITLAEIKDVRGGQGSFEVDVFQKARYVDMTKCIACGACAEKCPKKVDDLYNAGLAKRKAIYVPYPQAVPLKYAIDADNCIRFTKGKCGNCEKTCPAGAINYNDKDKNLTLKVGSIILAPGFNTYNPSGKAIYNYDASKDVVTSIEFERYLSASGPNQGHVTRPSDNAHPHKIAWLQCVGSRDINTCGNGYCSSVCCMYAIKQAIIAKEHDPSLECTVFYMDMRTHGKGFESCYNEAKDKHGIKFVRCKVHSLFTQEEKINNQENLDIGSVEDKDAVEGKKSVEDSGEQSAKKSKKESKNKNIKQYQVLNYFDEESGKVVTDLYDIVVLSVGMEISPETKALAEKIGIGLTDSGFIKTSSFDPVATTKDGFYVCGAVQGTKDIPQSVVEAGGAAMRAGTALAAARNTLTKTTPERTEIDIKGERPRVGVFVCHCGSNIASIIDVAAVRDYAATLPYVEYVATNMYSCSQDAQDGIANIVKEKQLNRMIVAACSPRTHEPLFQETLLSAGINKYLFEMVNIRNHGSWVHKDYPLEATQKAKDLVRMAVAKSVQLEPLAEADLNIDQNVVVIGGGISGMTAAKSLADQGYKVNIIEQNTSLGGQAKNLYQTAGRAMIQEGLGNLTSQITSHENITVFTGAEIEDVEGFVGNFKTTISSCCDSSAASKCGCSSLNSDKDGATSGTNSKTIEHGVTIIATGASELKPTEYMYGKDKRIVTGIELDKMFINNDPALTAAKSAVFIQCVGSRELQRPYCSRICCSHSVISALHLKEKNPDMNIFILYRDIRTYGEKELLYKEAREKGIIFIRYDLANKPEVSVGDGKLNIKVIDHVLKMPIVIEADLLTLASAVVPYKDEKLAQFFKVPLNEDGFFVEAHVKLAPSDFATDGVFLCGLAHYPKPIDESIAQAQAAASSALRLLSKKTIKTQGTIAEVNQTICSGCGVCLSVCPYNAPSLRVSNQNEGRPKPHEGKAEINPVLCKGCGACVSSCRSGALKLKGFDDGQLLAMIESAMNF